jgi:hypothetical protein
MYRETCALGVAHTWLRTIRVAYPGQGRVAQARDDVVRMTPADGKNVR